MVNIQNQLHALRQNLLDLTMRNHLLNFRSTRARTTRIVDEIPTELYDILVLKEKAMAFLPKREPPTYGGAVEDSEQGQFEDFDDDSSDLTREETSMLWKLPTPDTEVAARHVDRFLQTSLEGEFLQKRLFYIYQGSRSIFEELGYSTLYLAMGFLEWTESPDSAQIRKAPLILVPVELERAKVGSSFKLRWTGEDITSNISLQAKLSEQGISLPDFEMPEAKAGIDQYFQFVAKAVSTVPKWRVVTDIYLGLFSFTKFIMYRDLDPNVWPEGMSPGDHPLIRAILDPADITRSDQGFMEDEVDEKLVSRDLYHVMDADPSQIAVIEDVKAGCNLVVEGPPGTGKSQTIANIIAELLAAGKSVLFVSEKMAALEVVKSRLDQVGLGDFCLELHSRKSNKKDVLKELERTISRRTPQSTSSGEEFDQLETLKSDLNGYAKALKEPFGKLQCSPFALFCMKEGARRHFAEVGRDMPNVEFSDPKSCDQEKLEDARRKLRELEDVLVMVHPIAEHPWFGCEPGVVLPSDEDAILKLVEKCVEATSDLETRIDSLVDVCGARRPATLEDLSQAISAARVVGVSKPVARHILMSPEWNKPSKQADVLIDKVASFRDMLSTTLAHFKYEAVDEDIVSILEDYKNLSAKFFKLFNSRYRFVKRQISALYKDRPPKSAEMIVADLKQLVNCKALRDEIRGDEQAGHALFGSNWKADQSDPRMLRSFAEWIVSFRRQLLAEALTERAVDIVSTGVSQTEVEKVLGETEEATKQFAEQLAALFRRVGATCEVIFGTVEDSVPFSKLVSHLALWKAELPRLQGWSQYVARRNSCLNTVASPIVRTIEEGALYPDDVIACFEGNFADSLLRLVFAERPALSNFVGTLHERKIGRFAHLDSQLITRNPQRLVQLLFQNRPRIAGGASPGSEVGILLGEFSRRRRHMPIRKLLSAAGGLIQKFKPCFMMSPLSIAQFLDPRTVRFDVIVFDEASQVRPEDALGALLRGNQLVVMGDTRQLPPTTFFDHIVEGIEADDQDLPAPVAEVESILHQCKRCFPTKLLRWHYRSRHESLIAVSNQEFYDNQLLLYPSAIDKSEQLGLKFVYLPDTTYDRGRSAQNRKEARTVAEAALEHYRRFPTKSLGIGAFNIKQQQAILEEIELQLRLHAEMEDFFKSDRKEHFFVKNLETIQGDERDVIFLSIGFGFDISHRLTLNFGPLNHEGGERRLNVLTTRAREKCVVFSNFRAGDLSLDANAPFGLRALKAFLDYAETGNLSTEILGRKEAESPFEESVRDCLRSRGYEVRTQVGCAGFRVDLAIVDPGSPGRYLLGIECDGRKYHTSPVARDRDRLRQQILENLGWHIHRVWSTDWYRNRNETEQRLLHVIEQARYEKPTQVAHSPDIMITEASHHTRNNPVENAVFMEMPQNSTYEDMIPDYEVCTSLKTPLFGELHLCSAPRLAEMITRVVDVEGPVHFDEVVRRIRTLWGLQRAGQRINDAIKHATSVAKARGQIRMHGAFLWPAKDRDISVRRRKKDPPTNIDFICDEEIAESVRIVLRHQFATMISDLIVRSSRLLGFQAMHDKATTRINRVIRGLIDKGELHQMANGMMHLVESKDIGRSPQSRGGMGLADTTAIEEGEKPISQTPPLPDSSVQQLQTQEPKLKKITPRVAESEIYNYPPNFFFKLAHWAKEEKKLKSWERRLIYNIGKYCYRGWQISEKMERQALRIIQKAKEAGFSKVVLD